MSRSEELLEKAKKLLKKGKVDEAIKEFERYIEIYGRKDVSILNLLAELYSQKQDSNNAIRCCMAAVKVLKKDGFYSHAVAAAKAILALDNGNLEARAELVELFKLLGMNAEAQKRREELDLISSQVEAKTREAEIKKEKAQREIANAAVEAAIAQRQQGDQEAEKFLRELHAKISDAFPATPKKKKSKK